jgi:hypothetical protein
MSSGKAEEVQGNEAIYFPGLRTSAYFAADLTAFSEKGF